MIRQKLTIEEEIWLDKEFSEKCPSIFVLALVPNNGIYWKFFACYTKKVFEKLGDIYSLIKKHPGFTRTLAVKVLSVDNDLVGDGSPSGSPVNGVGLCAKE